MILREKKVIFIHIPKTGGNSVSKVLLPFSESYLLDAHSPSGFGNGENFWTIDPVIGNDKHFSVTQYEKLLGKEISKYVLFTIVRNPWDRLVSLYFFRKQTSAEKPTWIDKSNSTSPKSFCKNEFRRFLMSDEPSMSSFVESPKSTSVHIMRFENLSEEFRDLCERINLDPIDLPRLNASSRCPYRDILDNEMKWQISDLYYDDIMRFGYQY